MSDVLAELREAEATILRMRDAATPQPWTYEPRPSGEKAGIWRHFEFFGPQHEMVMPDVETIEDPQLIVLSVSVLVEVVLPIIQDAIKAHEDPLAPRAFGGSVMVNDFDAVRLARFVNERSK